MEELDGVERKVNGGRVAFEGLKMEKKLGGRREHRWILTVGGYVCQGGRERVIFVGKLEGYREGHNGMVGSCGG